MIIAFDPCFAPVTACDRQGRPEGVAIALLTEAFARAGIPFEWRAIPMHKAEPALLGRGVDAIAVLGISPERRLQYDFSPLLLRSGGAFFARKGHAGGVAKSAIATPSSGPLLSYLATKYPAARLLPVVGYDEALQAVASGVADFAALNWHVGRQLIRDGGHFGILPPRALFLPIDLALAVRKNTFASELAALAENWPGPSLDSVPPIDD